MKALIQRVKHADVVVNHQSVGAIDQGLLAFIGIEKQDEQAKADKLLNKILGYRIFADEQGKMNKSLADINGGLLLVSQFTLAADTKKGMRPSFSSAAAPDLAEQLYDYTVAQAKALHQGSVQTGSFAADMQITLLNDGPVTFMLEA